MDTSSLLSWNVRLNTCQDLSEGIPRNFLFLMFEKKKVNTGLYFMSHFSISHLWWASQAKLYIKSNTSLLSCHNRGLPPHRQRLLVACMFLVALNFSISQSNYIFIKICRNFGIWSKSGTGFIYFCHFYENSLLYGKLIATFKLKL